MKDAADIQSALAFLILVRQQDPLIGHAGILPADRFLDRGFGHPGLRGDQGALADLPRFPIAAAFAL